MTPPEEHRDEDWKQLPPTDKIFSGMPSFIVWNDLGTSTPDTSDPEAPAEDSADDRSERDEDPSLPTTGEQTQRGWGSWIDLRDQPPNDSEEHWEIHVGPLIRRPPSDPPTEEKDAG